MFGTLVVLGLLQSICVYACLAHSFREYTYFFYFTCMLPCATLDLLFAVVILGFGCVGHTPPVSLRALSMLNDETRMPKRGTAAAWH
jgi:multidrug efflux pump subunit AcrB